MRERARERERERDNERESEKGRAGVGARGETATECLRVLGFGSFAPLLLHHVQGTNANTHTHTHSGAHTGITRHSVLAPHQEEASCVETDTE